MRHICRMVSIVFEFFSEIIELYLQMVVVSTKSIWEVMRLVSDEARRLTSMRMIFLG